MLMTVIVLFWVPDSDYRDFVREQARAGRTLVVVQVGERGYIGRESKDGNEDADNFLVVRGGGGGQAQEGAWSQGALMRAFFDPGKGRGSRRVTWVHAFDDPPTCESPLLLRSAAHCLTRVFVSFAQRTRCCSLRFC